MKIKAGLRRSRRRPKLPLSLCWHKLPEVHGGPPDEYIECLNIQCRMEALKAEIRHLREDLVWNKYPKLLLVLEQAGWTKEEIEEAGF